MRIIITFIFCASSVFAAPVTFKQDDPKHSRVIVVAGEEKILMPDGRVLPFGQGILCTEECPEITEVVASNRRWAVPVIAAGIITTAVLWPRNPRNSAPPIDTPPIAPVPESATIVLLASAGLFFLPRFFKPRIKGFFA